MFTRLIVNNLLLFGILVQAEEPNRPYRDVKTIQGTVRGYLYGRPPHYAFLGIPYARTSQQSKFKAPEVPPKWSGVFEARYRVKCMQPNGEGDQNCLVVNVFTPEYAENFSVLVHVHDGAFQSGWGSYRPASRLLQKDLVVVTFNYRLGALGFLCLSTPQAPGNAGLKDQVSLLYWVQRNIKYFGGNPEDVTLYGTGSGAISAELLVISGLTKGLVAKVILESGTAISPVATVYDPVNNAFEVASFLRFKGNKTAENIANFFQKLQIKELLSASNSFMPCVEHNFHLSNNLLEGDPRNILQDGSYNHVPLLIVYSEVKVSLKDAQKFKVIPDNFENLLPTNLDFGNKDIKSKVAKLVKDFYFGSDLLEEHLIQDYIDYINDIFIEYPIVKSASLHARKSPHQVYLMKFLYHSDNVMDLESNYGDIGNFIFSKPGLQYQDELTAERLTNLLGNFIQVGDPTPLITSLTPVVWQPVAPNIINGKLDVIQCLEFKSQLTMTELSPMQRLLFWDHIYENFYRFHSTFK